MLNKTHNIPVPYGTIPKYKKNNNENKTSCTAVPYPFFSNSTSSSFLSFLSTLFTKKEQVGFMPFQNNEPIIQPYLDIISRSEPIDCQHHHNTEQQDNNSSFSTSTSSSTSSNSSCSSNYFDMNEMFSFDDNTTALSDILCDHYIQSKAQLNNDTADVPLETFRIFEAPSVENDHWILKQKEKEWTLVEQSEKYAAKQELAKEEEQENEMNHHHHVRDIRTNSDYFRIIVAEVNMMRAQKIVGPLRQRRLLPKRSDSFEYRSSPLRYQAV